MTTQSTSSPDDPTGVASEAFDKETAFDKRTLRFQAVFGDRRMVFSAPFGNYFSHPGWVSTLGTFTLNRRPGRLWRLLRTLRYHRRMQGWSNQLGLRNPGISWLAYKAARSGRLDDHIRRSIVSVHGFDAHDWEYLAEYTKQLHPAAVELNVSCPNAPMSDDADYWRRVLGHFHRDGMPPVILKLPPVNTEFFVELSRPWLPLLLGYHFCNTYPLPGGGGLSGEMLKPHSLYWLREYREEFPDHLFIGGGGVSCREDVETYIRAGADMVGVASALFHPSRWGYRWKLRQANAQYAWKAHYLAETQEQ